MLGWWVLWRLLALWRWHCGGEKVLRFLVFDIVDAELCPLVGGPYLRQSALHVLCAETKFFFAVGDLKVTEPGSTCLVPALS